MTAAVSSSQERRNSHNSREDDGNRPYGQKTTERSQVETTEVHLKVLRLKPGEERRIQRGHLWVYSNEIADNLRDFEPGEAVSLADSRGTPLGSGTVNPHSLISVRIHSRRADEELDLDYLERKIATAARLRERLGYADVCRLVHAEADGLPGLVIDRYGDIFAIQHNSVGIDRRRDLILDILDRLFSPRCVIAADDTSARELEGLPRGKAVAGDPPGEVAWYSQDGLEFPIDLTEGQKTGGYLDQVTSQRFLATLAKGGRFLDAFSYTGGFGLRAAAAGAKRVVLADSSQRALDLAREAFARNHLDEPVLLKTDLLHDSESVADLGGPFDVVTCDPPPLVKSKAKLAEGLRKYETLFSKALSWTSPEGLAALFSCSHQVGREELHEQVKRAERRTRRRTRRLAILSAGMDHPVLFSHIETEYLHGVLLQVG